MIYASFDAKGVLADLATSLDADNVYCIEITLAQGEDRAILSFSGSFWVLSLILFVCPFLFHSLHLILHRIHQLQEDHAFACEEESATLSLNLEAHPGRRMEWPQKIPGNT